MDEMRRRAGTKIKLAWLFSTAWISIYYYQFFDSILASFVELNVNVIVANEARQLDNAEQGDLVILLGNSHPKKLDLKKQTTEKKKQRMASLYIENAAHALKRRNVTFITYETEPLGVSQTPERYFGSSRVWTYSHGNMKFLTDVPGASYLPPAYSIAVDYPNRLPSLTLLKKKKEKSDVKQQDSTSRIVSVVGGDQRQRLGELRDRIPGLRNVVDAWTHEDFALKIASNRIAINVHKINKTCLEMFRLAPMLSSGLRVVSEHSDVDDERLLKGLVIFAEKKEMPSIVAKLAKADLRKKESRARLEVIRRFRRRFNLTDLLRRELVEIGLW